LQKLTIGGDERNRYSYYKHYINRSEYNRLRNLINIQAKNDKEEWLGQYCEETENQLNRGNTENPYKLIGKFFLENLK